MARRSRSRRRSQERAFEGSVYALILVIFVIAAMFPEISAQWITLTGGAILVGSAIYQSNRRWQVNISTWAGGLLLLGVGILALYTGRAVPMGMLFPVAILGGVVVISLVTGRL